MTINSTSIALYALILLSSSAGFAQNMSPANLIPHLGKTKSQIETVGPKLKIEDDPLAAQKNVQRNVDPKIIASKKILDFKKFGTGSSGGGTGCRSNFLAAAHQVSQWLTTNGQGLKPGSISYEEFDAAIAEPEKVIRLVPETTELTYRGENVTALYDGNQIQVRCDRLNRENPAGLKRVVAHEIFRKMGLEGDDYNYTKQVLGPAWAAANIAYTLDKQVVVMSFANDPKSLVKISTKSGNTEFFGIRECPNSAITQTEGDTEIAWEECKVVGGSYYKALDLLAVQSEMSKEILAAEEKYKSGEAQAEGILTVGIVFVSGGMLLYASDASQVAGLKQIGRFIDSYIKLINPKITFRQLMKTKGAVAAVAISVGTTLAYSSISSKENAARNFSSDLAKSNITLKTNTGYVPFGISLITEFKGEQGAQAALKKIIVDTLTQFEERNLIKSFGKP